MQISSFDLAAAGSMSCVEAAEVALRILHQLVRMQAAVDADGNPLQPLPIVHRTLASPQCLPHIAQVGLCSLWPLVFAIFHISSSILYRHRAYSLHRASCHLIYPMMHHMGLVLPAS